MKLKTKERMYNALTTAAAMIEGHVEVGIHPEAVGEETEEGLREYTKACERSAKQILTLAKKYKT
tara:strand:- start:761 stop:955 length:195 start_codon:yes stop_codon:yes gene_type:complete